MNVRYFDAHTHVQFAAYDADREAVVARARAAGVGMVNVGTQRDTSRAAVELTRAYPDGVWATVGLHPIHTARSFHDVQELGGPFSNSRESENGSGGFVSRGEEFDYDYYRALAVDPKVVAVGECGLDYAAFVRERRERQQRRASAEASSEGGLTPEKIERYKEKQREVFTEQIELAHEVQKPLMIHCRDAFPDLIDILATKYKILNTPPGIIHFFSGTVEEAKKLLDLGFSFTFGGVVTFARDYDEVIRMIPLDRILSETDAPYVAPVPYRGKRNEPAYVIEVVKKLAELKGVSVEAMVEQIRENVRRTLGNVF